jgi:hypothetical protein
LPKGLVVATLLATPTAIYAQTPAIPGAPALPGGPIPTAVPGAAGVAGAATPAAGAPAAPSNIWSFFMKTPAQKAQIKACICGSPIGQFLNNMMMPVGLMSGGIIGPICPGPNTPSAADLAKPATSAQGAAAKIKAEEAQAKAKIAALEYLATVDCRYYPEAEAAMISGLRAEKNECVRIAAAKALANGCCCSAKVVKALTICVDCSTKDGFPAEASELVRAYAYVALERCLRKCVQADENPPEPPAAAKKAMYESIAPLGSVPDYTVAILLAGYYSLDSMETVTAVFAAARLSLAKGLQLSPRTATRLAGPRNVRDTMFPGPGRMLAASTPPTPPPPSETPAEPRVFTVNNTEPIEPGQPIPVTAVPSGDKKPGRGNILNILQDAWKH